MLNSAYIPVLNFLRAFACLGVCTTHCYYGSGFYCNNELGINGFLCRQIEFGQNGVAVFFVISGFVIPWSLYHSKFLTSDFFKFLLKRIIRIDPPYILAMILVCLTGVFFHNKPFQVYQFVLHFFYFIPFSDYSWYDGVYWTLFIEFQYYILIGLIFQFLLNSPKYITLSLFLFLCYVGYYTQFPNNGAYILKQIHYFIAGLVLFLYFNSKITKIDFWAFLTLLLVIMAARVSITVALLATLTPTFIVFFRNFQTSITDFLGKISYSLYLIHSLSGGLLAYFLQKNGVQPFFIFVSMILFAVLCAWLFYFIIEKPALKWSKKVISY